MPGTKYSVNIGDKFGYWEVLSSDTRTIKKTHTSVLCKCASCGKEQYVYVSNLVRGNTSSCKKCYHELRKTKYIKMYDKIPADFFTRLKDSAKVRNIEFNLSPFYLSDLLINQGGKCAISGLPIKIAAARIYNPLGRGRFDYASTTASLDRINSNKGYAEDNVHWIHKVVNLAKGCIPLDKFLYLCDVISTNNAEIITSDHDFEGYTDKALKHL